MKFQWSSSHLTWNLTKWRSRNTHYCNAKHKTLLWSFRNSLHFFKHFRAYIGFSYEYHKRHYKIVTFTSHIFINFFLKWKRNRFSSCVPMNELLWYRTTTNVPVTRHLSLKINPKTVSTSVRIRQQLVISKMF